MSRVVAKADPETSAVLARPAGGRRPTGLRAPMVQRMPLEEGARGASPAPAVAALLVEDGQPTGPGQMHRGEFVAMMRALLTARCDTELAVVGRSAEGCPYLARWLDYYERQPAAHLERAIRIYTGTAAKDAASLMSAVLSRVVAAVRIWVATGRITGIPAAAASPRGPDGGGVIQRTAAAGAPPLPMGTERLAPGVEGPIEPATLRAASLAFGRDLSHVRVSTGRAPGGPGTLGAAWGNRIVLDQSLDREPPLVRKLVLAHELAHVAQQAEATRTADEATSDPRSSGRHEVAHLEANASAAAASMLAGKRASVVSAPLTLSRCARPAGGMITAAHFRFETTVPIRPGDGDPAGWQAAAVRARMSKDVGGVPYGVVYCVFEVGVPLRNHRGPVSSSFAAQAAAAAANSAAYTVLSSGTPATSTDCILFRRLMQAELEVVIPGATVGAHVSRVPLVNFP